MLFNSISFLIFFVLITSIYFVIPHRFRWMLLLAGSCYFYMAFVPIYIIVLGFIITVDYFAGIKIEQSTGKKKRFFLICSLATNIGVLAFFKYYNFINQNITSLLHYGNYINPFPFMSFLLPIGLSFHTFQAMSYTIEVSRGNQRAERHFGIYALYVMYYPQLVAGPIERPQNLIHQFYEEHPFDYKRVTNGLKLMLWGFFKKIVIADNLALISNAVFNDAYHFKGLAVVLAAIAFSIQIYCDFSGYSDIAIGASQVMGITLMNNFRQPYLASSVTEFWTRWHISLSTWFRDYLYIPLGGNRVTIIRWCFNILVVFLLSGLWHGANWTYVVWGVINGLYLIIDKFFKPLRNKLAISVGLAKLSTLSKLLNIAVTFTIVSFTWIFFRATNISQAFYLVKSAFNQWRVGDVQSVLVKSIGSNSYLMFIFFFVLLLMLVQFYQERYGSVRELISKQPIAARWIIYLLTIYSIILFGAFDNIPFIYFQF